MIAHPPRLVEDLDHILRHTGSAWDALRGQRVFMTGGTGFVGCWLLESLLWANDRLGLNASVTVLTRDAEAFRAKAPHLAEHPSVRLHPGDVRSFAFPEGRFPFIIHGAVSSSPIANEPAALSLMRGTIVEGTRHTLEFARSCGATRLLFLSSGAVYDPSMPGVTHLSEDDRGAPDAADRYPAHTEGKRAAEDLCNRAAPAWGIRVKMARCFSFVGPYQPLDGRFAIGNFLRDGLSGEAVHVTGDGTAVRAYLYAADLAIWLWRILFHGRSCHPYNVGSEQAITIADAAHVVAGMLEPQPSVRIAQAPAKGQAPDRYVPSTRRAQSELHLQQTIDFVTAVRKSLVWHRETLFARQIRPVRRLREWPAAMHEAGDPEPASVCSATDPMKEIG